MTRFTTDNTEGYKQAELDELNRRFDAAIVASDPIDDDVRKSHEDHIAERILAEFDTRD